MTRVALRDGLFTFGDDSAEPRLLASRCSACGCHVFPVQELCPYCGAQDSATVELQPYGVVEVCTTVVNRPPGYEGQLPFGFGVVELPEGLRLISRLRDVEHMEPGSKVRLVLEAIATDSAGREVVTYAFEPTV